MTRRNPPCPKIAKGQPCTPCEALAVVEQEISKTENRLAAPQAKHSLLFSQINHSHDPLASKLPIEIVSKIFTNFLPIDVDTNYGPCVKSSSYRYHTTPLVLGAVCAAWRSIAWSTPQLWASISVDLIGNNETRIDIVREWLHRSRELPLYIGIHHVNSYIYDDFNTGTTLNALATYSHRWFYLAFNIPRNYIWPRIISRLNLTNALMLNTLQIWRSNPQDLDLGMIPNLKNLYTNTLSDKTLLNIDWTKLTNVVTSFQEIDMCLKLFSNAPLLTHCEFTLDTCSWDEICTTPKARIRHKHLIFLRLIVLKSTVSISMALSWMEFPALRHLVFGSQVIQIDLDAIRGLILRSHCSLKTLEMDLTPHTFDLADARGITPFLEEISTLESLEIRREASNYYNQNSSYSINPLLTQLSTTTLTTEIAKDRLTFLPNLRNLRVKNMESSWNCILDMLLAHGNPAQTLAATRSDEESQKVQRVRPLRSFSMEMPVWEEYNEGSYHIPLVCDTPAVFQCTIEDGIEVTHAAGLDNMPGYLPFRESLKQTLRHSEM